MLTCSLQQKVRSVEECCDALKEDNRALIERAHEMQSDVRRYIIPLLSDRSHWLFSSCRIFIDFGFPAYCSVFFLVSFLRG